MKPDVIFSYSVLYERQAREIVGSPLVEKTKQGYLCLLPCARGHVNAGVYGHVETEFHHNFYVRWMVNGRWKIER